jgi:hypothetical protein
MMLVGSSLFCIGANKGLNDFSMKKEVILIFFLLSFFGYRDYSLYKLWVTKNKVHGAFVFVLVAHS